MREFKRGEYVSVRNEIERDLFLNYLDANTNIVWNDGGGKPSEYTPNEKFPYCFTLTPGEGFLLHTVNRENVSGSGVLKVSDFVQTKPEPTWAMFWDDNKNLADKGALIVELDKKAFYPYIVVREGKAYENYIGGKQYHTTGYKKMGPLPTEESVKDEILAEIEAMSLDELINLREKL